MLYPQNGDRIVTPYFLWRHFTPVIRKSSFTECWLSCTHSRTRSSRSRTLPGCNKIPLATVLHCSSVYLTLKTQTKFCSYLWIASYQQKRKRSVTVCATCSGNNSANLGVQGTMHSPWHEAHDEIADLMIAKFKFSGLLQGLVDLHAS